MSISIMTVRLWKVKKTHCIVERRTGTQMWSQPEFSGPGSPIPFVVRTRSSQRITSRVIVAHLWWLSKGRCSQSQFKHRLRLKWHELYRRNAWRFDLYLALHENSCTWEARRLTTTNSYTCVWQNVPRGRSWLHPVCCLSSHEISL